MMADDLNSASLDKLLSEALDRHHSYALILLDSDGLVRGWFGGAEEIFGWRPDEMEGEPLDRIFVPEDRERGSHKQELEIATTIGASPDDRWQQRKDGSRFWGEGILTALRDSSGDLTGFVKILRNRIEGRGEEDLLQNRIRALEEHDARKTAFLATIVHELRGPLAPLTNAIMLIEPLIKKQPDLEYPAAILSRQVALLRRLVDDLGEMVRIGSGKLELKRQTVDLNEVVQAAVESCLDQARTRDQHIESLLPPVPTPCPVDAERIHQVLVNLITNASKYTPPHGHVWVQLTVEGEEAVIRVRDDGIGIRPEMQSRIFDLFTQIPTEKSMSDGGLGLGLPVVRELVQLHGGSVQVHSEGDHKGSEFVVKLPLHVS